MLCELFSFHVRLLSQRTEKKISPMDQKLMRAPQTVWDGACGGQGLLLEVMMMKTNFRLSEGVEWEVLIMSRKLDFGLQKVGKGDTLWSVFPEICYDLCSSTLFFASLLKTTLAHWFWHSYIFLYCHDHQHIAKQHAYPWPFNLNTFGQSTIPFSAAPLYSMILVLSLEHVA